MEDARLQNLIIEPVFLTSAQPSAEVRALQRALSFFGVYASLILDGLPFRASKNFNSNLLLQTKQLSSHVISVCVYVLFTVLFSILRSPGQDANASLLINKIPESPQVH